MENTTSLGIFTRQQFCNEGDISFCRSSTYPELDHEGVHDAADHRDEVERVPGVLEEILLGEETREKRKKKSID